MGDPVGAAGERPFAHDHVADSLNPAGQIVYAGSTMICKPASSSHEAGRCLGAQVEKASLRKVITESGSRASAEPWRRTFNPIWCSKRGRKSPP